MEVDKREAILNAAVRLFSTQGFQQTTTAQISKEAGVATGTLFNYFESKSELIRQLHLHCRDSMAEALQIDRESQAPYLGAFRTIIERGVRWGLGNPSMFWFFEQYHLSLSYGGRFGEEQDFFDHFDFIGEFIERGIREGRLQRRPGMVIYTILISAVAGTVKHLLLTGQPAEEFVDDAVDLLLRGVVADTG